MGIHDLDAILERAGVAADQWARVAKNKRFQGILRNEIEAWNGALNTHERVKIKSAVILEDWLPELHARLHDKDESLNSKIEGGKLAASLAGLGRQAQVGGAAENLVVTINLGADHNIKFEKNITPTLESEVVAES